ncbi:C-terminal binding protein [Rhodococcus pyridinivorans]|uniref:C-terminal binding protein n=1 Tax=Rhodococcus pyridinivorans TaxID=103816 RepID=UPI000AB7D757|nr:C-terminal binding protein [Rhodococcus pyridinivorans]
MTPRTDNPQHPVVVVLDHAFGSLTAERATAADHNADFREHQCRTEQDVASAAQGALVVLVNQAPVNEAALASMQRGGAVIRYGVGYDNVDLDAAAHHGIAVANIPDYGSRTVADHAASLIVTLLRRIPEYDSAVRQMGWLPPAGLGPIHDFASTTIGLVGVGRIGRELHTRLAPFGFSVIAHDPFADVAAMAAIGIEMVDLDVLLARSNAISLHLPLTSETHHIINARTLDLMRDDAVLVNTSRGPLVDARALCEALESGHLRGAGLDVFEEEPLPEDSPLRRAPRLVLTPHTAFYSEQSLARLQQLAAEEAGRAIRGEELRCKVV